jgi:hypothetical protein
VANVVRTERVELGDREGGVGTGQIDSEIDHVGIECRGVLSRDGEQVAGNLAG